MVWLLLTVVVQVCRPIVVLKIVGVLWPNRGPEISNRYFRWFEARVQVYCGECRICCVWSGAEGRPAGQNGYDMKTNIVQRIEVVLGTRRGMSEQRCQSCHALAARASEEVAGGAGQ
jgi:hypothetical protein